MRFAVGFQGQRERKTADALATRLGFDLVDLSNLNDSSTKQHNFPLLYKFLLRYKNDVLYLQETDSGLESCVDFGTISTARLSKKIDLARAVGIKGRYLPTIIDATAGMGRDAYTLAALGCEVTLIEHSEIIFSLLEDGFDRQSQAELEITGRMNLHQANAVTLIPELDAHDVIYLDPMYAERGKQALPKKEMQLFRKLLGHDTDVDSLLEVALEHAKKRVVVKRHRTAKALMDKKPSAEIVGKQTRFDIYLV